MLPLCDFPENPVFSGALMSTCVHPYRACLTSTLLRVHAFFAGKGATDINHKALTDASETFEACWIWSG